MQTRQALDNSSRMRYHIANRYKTVAVQRGWALSSDVGRPVLRVDDVCSEGPLARIEGIVPQQSAVLQQRLTELNERIAALEGAIADKPDFGLGKGDPRVTRWELNRALLEQLREHVASTEDALSRLEHGMYGVCERCGQAIHPDRLAVLPDTRLCIGCARSERLSAPGQRGSGSQ